MSPAPSRSLPAPPGPANSRGAASTPPRRRRGALYDPLTTLEIVAAVPEGSRRIRSQKTALRLFLADPELADLRADFRANVLEVWRFLVRWSFTGDGTTMPVRSRLCAELGISESTWKRCRRWIEARGWLGTIRRGWSGILRASSLDDGEPNEAAVYVLAAPARTRKSKPSRPPGYRSPITDPLRWQPPVTDPSHWSPKPRIKTGKAAADAATLYRRHVAVVRQGPVRALSDKWVCWALRPFLSSGYSPADLGYAIAYSPGSGRHTGSPANVRNPGAWLGWRLSRWFPDPEAAWASWQTRGRWPDDARPVPSRSARSWAGVEPVGQTYLARNRRRAAAAAAPELARIQAAAIRDRLGWKRKDD